MHPFHRTLLRSGGIVTAVASLTCASAHTASASDLDGQSRPAQVQVFSRAELGVIDKGWWRALYTASIVEPGGVGYLLLDPLRLFSYDEVQPGGAFALHSHDNIEVITIVLEGSFEHEDTAGHSGRAGVGDVMLMSAGHGVKHAEHGNADALTRVVTIWLRPRTANSQPHHQIRRPAAAADGWQLVAAERGAPLTIDQDARVLMRHFAAGERSVVEALPGRVVYLGTVEGELVANGRQLVVPERVIARNGELVIAASSTATAVLIDLPQS